jgi:hypothetical protein
MRDGKLHCRPNCLAVARRNATENATAARKKDCRANPLFGWLKAGWFRKITNACHYVMIEM